ncbi:MAG: pyridoxal-phosphate dependent enzyme [Thermaerobacterales bacterium]
MAYLHCTNCSWRGTEPIHGHIAIRRCPECTEPVEVRFGDGRWPMLDSLYSSESGLGEGNTPLLAVSGLRERLGIPNLWLKNEPVNPTGSFKDRGTAAEMAGAAASGFDTVAVVSSGNMAASVAAYGAAAGVRPIVIVPADTQREKLLGILAFDPIMVLAEGNVGDIRQQAERAGAELDIPFFGPDSPLRVEGQKTIAFEIAAQIGGVDTRGAAGWNALAQTGDLMGPDYVFVPISSGGHMAAVLKGFEELVAAGVLQKMPQVVGVQSSGCDPIARAFLSGGPIEPLPGARTRAHAIGNSTPSSGDRVLRVLRRLNSGGIIAVPDDDMLAVQRLIAETTGLFVQMESAASVAGLIAWQERFGIAEGARIACILTGSGLKDVATVTEWQGTRSEIRLPAPGGPEQWLKLLSDAMRVYE